MTHTPVLVPYEPDTTFVFGDGRLECWCIPPKPTRFHAGSDTIRPMPIFIRTHRFAYVSRNLKWQGFVFHTPEDTDRAIHALRLAEAAIGLFVFIRLLCNREAKRTLDATLAALDAQENAQ